MSMMVKVSIGWLKENEKGCEKINDVKSFFVVVDEVLE